MQAALTALFIVAGAWGDSANATNGSGNTPVGVVGTADDSAAGLFANNSASATLQADNEGAGSTGLFKVFRASTPKGVCGIGDGDLSCTGQVKSLVSTSGGVRKVETYAPQSAENWMEDYGNGTMQLGEAVVKIDPAFAETVSETADYHVFLTPNADSRGPYVINKTPTSFEVRESGGGTSSLTFDYKIVAKRRGYENQRLVDVTERFNDEQARSIAGRARVKPVTEAAVEPRPQILRPVRKPVVNGPGPNGTKSAPASSPVRRTRPTGGRVVGNDIAAPLARP